MACSRPMWSTTSSQNPSSMLRKQKSCIEVFPSSKTLSSQHSIGGGGGSTNGSTNGVSNNSGGRTIGGGGRITLQKQMSIDQHHFHHNHHHNSTTTNSNLMANRSLVISKNGGTTNSVNNVSNTNKNNYCQLNNIQNQNNNYQLNNCGGIVTNNNNNNNNGISGSGNSSSGNNIGNNSENDGKPEASLKIFTAVKKRIPNENISSTKSTERIKKPLTNARQNNQQHQQHVQPPHQQQRDDRINLNIFLSTASSSQDGDLGGTSDLDDNSEKELSVTITKKSSSPIIEKQSSTVCSSTITNSNNVSANNNSDSIQPTTSSLASAQSISSSASINTNNYRPTAAERRAAFQSSKTLVSPSQTGHPIQSSITIARPPLIRAMSAPIRSFDDGGGNYKNGGIAAGKRRQLRRRKILRDRVQSPVDDFQDETFIEGSGEDDDFSSTIGNNNNSKLKSLRKTTGGNGQVQSMQSQLPSPTQQPPRSRSVLGGCDVVTLVSLLSSGGSDSEKEDVINKNDIISVGGGGGGGRAPMLKKTGKSVSFQDDDSPTNLSTTSREFPLMLRRGSIAPLAARIRLNRPPTAPPGSIYIRDFDSDGTTVTMDKLSKSNDIGIGDGNNSDNSIKNNSKQFSSYDGTLIKSLNNEQTNVIGTGTLTDDGSSSGGGGGGSGANGSNSCDNTPNGIIIENYPEFCRSKKEKDCWKLYQKMLTKGVTVSYDTILRGMLTPTELRAVQKQKELDEIKQQQLIDDALLINECNNDNNNNNNKNTNEVSTKC